MKQEVKRCWNTSNPLYIKYHDEEWGIPIYNDKKLFEFLTLGVFQAGLTWELILNRRESFRTAFDNFEPKIVATYSDKKINLLLNNPKIIRNKQKITCSINNALKVLEIQKEFGSFSKFVWTFVKGTTIHNNFTKLCDLPCQSKESIKMSKDMKKMGFKFIGPTICYAFMQATGLVNDHLTTCFRYKEIRRN